MDAITKEKLKEKVKDLPLKPGVYIMLDKSGKVIYVGKAKALKNRVSQYFQDSASHTPKTIKMVSQIDDFNIIVADSEFEALVLECSLIKLHMPKYNILLKDGKGYPFVRLSKEEYPVFSLAGKKGKDSAEYFGPFGSRSVTRQAIEAVLLALKMPTCSRKFPRDIGKDRPCLNFSMGRCSGYCSGEPDVQAYRENIRRAEMIFQGKTEHLCFELETEMIKAADELQFERAAELRDKMRAVEKLGERQKVLSISLADMDVTGLYKGEGKTGFAVLHYVGGNLVDKDFSVIADSVEEQPEEILSQFAQQYYFERSQIPARILLPMEFDGSEELARYLSESCGRTVRFFVPKRGENLRLTQLANLNAKEEAQRQTTAEDRQNRLVELLGKTLSLKGVPKRIEGYDISNTGKSEIVGAMTVFVNGRAKKRDYRKFIVKDQTEQDDYAAMAQVIRRRLQRYKDGDEHFAPLPDLMLIDGGTGHTKVAENVVKEFGYDIAVFGMVKDDRHRTRALTDEFGREFGIKNNQSLFAFIGNIQEETHNTAINYHRKRRENSLRYSELDNIPGIGKARKAMLIEKFGSIKRIGEADLGQLKSLLPEDTAEQVYRHFHAEDVK